MVMSPKTSIGMSGGSGSPPFTKAGHSIQGATQAHEHLGIEAIRRFTGWLSDIRLPLGEERSDGYKGAMIQIYFDSSMMDEVWRDTWFRLAHDPVELLAQYGTEDTMRRGRIRVELLVYGVSVTRGVVKIIGDRKQESTHRQYTKTPVRCWADIIPGVAKGGP